MDNPERGVRDDITEAQLRLRQGGHEHIPLSGLPQPPEAEHAGRHRLVTPEEETTETREGGKITRRALLAGAGALTVAGAAVITEGLGLTDFTNIDEELREHGK